MILNRRKVYSYYYDIIMSFSIVVVVTLVVKPKQIVSAYICSIHSNSRRPFGVTSTAVTRTTNIIAPIPNKYLQLTTSNNFILNQYKYNNNFHNFRGRLYYYSSSSLKNDNNYNDSDNRDALYEKDQQQQERQQQLDLTMNNLYCEWTLDDDKLLFNNRHQSTIQLASLLGRGLRGVEARLGKLLDINTFAYQRLFVPSTSTTNNNGKKQQQSSHNTKRDKDNDEIVSLSNNKKLIPASEVLRRIKWDNTLNSNDFFILHYDRVEDSIKETCCNAPNTNISGKSTSFVDALPEHRIVGIKYKEQIVWDREKRIDLVFTTTPTNNNDNDSSDDSDNSSNGGIHRIIKEYDVWKETQDKLREIYRQRQEEVTIRIEQILEYDNKEILNELSNTIQQKLVMKNPKVSAKIECERYVKESLELFRQVRNNNNNINNNPSSSTSSSLSPNLLLPTSDYYSLDILSEFVSVFVPDVTVRDMILNEIDLQMKRIIPSTSTSTGIVSDTTSTKSQQKVVLPELDENDLIETYVRGSGPGGQKINKTSNRVVLVHVPTQLRVECQDTRNVHQNRKIARKLLREKLDMYINGSQSKFQQKAVVIASKKQKAKSKSKARLLRKQQEIQQLENEDDNNVESQEQSFSDLIDPDDAI